MKILHVLDERWDSGITAYGLALARAQNAAGLSVTVAAKPGFYAAQEAEKAGLPLVPLRTPWDLRADARRMRFDVLNAHTGAGHAWAAVAVAGRRLALVRTRGDARPLRRSLGQPALYRRTDAVVAVSDAIARQYEKLFPETAPRLFTVYPGLCTPPYAPEPAGPPRAALVGRLDPVKGHAVFFQALGLLRDRLDGERFLVSGEEKNLTAGRLQSMAQELNVDRWVRLSGRQPDVLAFMGGCHVGVVASVGSEALSRVCLEWMSRGKPVVASRVGSLPDLVEDGVTGFLVPPSDPRALADALWRLLSEAALRRRMGGKAREAAAKRFGVERWVSDTSRAYEAAVQRRRTA